MNKEIKYFLDLIDSEGLDYGITNWYTELLPLAEAEPKLYELIGAFYDATVKLEAYIQTWEPVWRAND